jgi:RNA polymerase sigma-70 factor (ECF subfamily)
MKKIDNELVKGVQEGSREAFELLHKQIDRKVGYLLNKLMVSNRYLRLSYDDIKQDIIIKIYDKMNLFQPTVSFDAWVSTMTRNHVFDILRKDKSKGIAFEFDGFDDSSVLIDDEFGVNEKRDNALLLDQIVKDSKFSQIQMDIFELRFIREMSYDGIAEVLNIPVGTVKTTIFRIKDILIQTTKRIQYER